MKPGQESGSALLKWRSPRRQGGVALAIVVWFIAGMSLLVAGIVADARVDTRMAQLHECDRAENGIGPETAVALGTFTRIGSERLTAVVVNVQRGVFG